MNKLLPLALFLAAIAGCSENTHPRVDFPTAPGNYVQFYYDDLGRVTVEIATVDSAGAIKSASTGVWQKPPRLDAAVVHEPALFNDCGIITFTDKKNGTVTSSRQIYGGIADCAINPMPSLWTPVKP